VKNSKMSKNEPISKKIYYGKKIPSIFPKWIYFHGVWSFLTKPMVLELSEKGRKR